MRRPIRIEGDVALVPLTRGYEAVIDAADVPLVDGVNWQSSIRRDANGEVVSVYAVRIITESGKRRAVLMHRLLAGTPDNLETDHVDCDGLNNRRSNLRIATRSENGRNRRLTRRNTSGVKGVTRSRVAGKWVAEIHLYQKKHYLGTFDKIEDAAAAYAKASAEMHGEFGRAECSAPDAFRRYDGSH